MTHLDPTSQPEQGRSSDPVPQPGPTSQASPAPRAPAPPRVRATLLRLVAAVGLLVTAAIHLVLYAEWAKNVSPLGEAFLAQAVAGVLLAGVLLVWRSPLPLLAAVLYGLGSIGAFFLSGATGFLGVTAQLVGWQEYVSKGAELVVVVAALLALRAERRREG